MRDDVYELRGEGSVIVTQHGALSVWKNLPLRGNRVPHFTDEEAIEASNCSTGEFFTNLRRKHVFRKGMLL